MKRQRSVFCKSTVLLTACLCLGMPGSLRADESTESLFPEAGGYEVSETETETETETEISEEEDLYEELHVQTPTPMEGNFFTEMWGNSVSDIDVRRILHGYDLVRWQSEEGMFSFDPSVVSGVMVTQNDAGDHIYTLGLYSDLYYNDGTPVTARDYAFSILLSIAPETAQIGADVRVADHIVGYREYASGEADVLSGVHMPDEHTLSITISHEYLPFFYELGLLDCIPCPVSVIAPGCTVVDNGEGIQIVNEDEKIREPLFTAELLKKTILDEETGYRSHPAVTCGPYSLVSYDAQKHSARLKINKYYKGNAEGVKPGISRILFDTAENSTMLEDLEEGDTDLLNKCVDAEAVARGVALIARDRQFAMSSYARSGLTYISFCCEQEAVSSAAVRRAIACCLDKEHLVKDYVGNYGLKADGYYGLGQWMVQILNGTLKYPLEIPESEEDEQALLDYEAQLEEWESLNLDEVKIYDFDIKEAVRLLEEDGWVLNRKGKPFDPEEDTVRCKKIGKELVSLELTLVYPDGNRIGESLDEFFTDNLEQAGIELETEQLPMDDLLALYYRENGKRDCDMIYLGTNFDLLFDPSMTFLPETEEETEEIPADEEETEEETEGVDGEPEETPGDIAEETEELSEDAAEEETGEDIEIITEEETEDLLDEEGETETLPDEGPEDEIILPRNRIYNTTGLSDSKLYELAKEMSSTQPGDALEYCRRWIAFQEEFSRLEPMIPVYSNVYFDFYPRTLQNYNIAEHVTWGQAIIESRLGDPALEEETEEPAEEMTEELGEGEILIED